MCVPIIGIMEVTTAPVTIDNTEKPYCGVGGNIEEATNGKGCDLTQQPCFYTLTVTKVFKGIKQVCTLWCHGQSNG